MPVSYHTVHTVGVTAFLPVSCSWCSRHYVFFCMPLLGVEMDVVLIDPCGTVGKPKPDIATTKLPSLGVPHFFWCLAFNATTRPGIAQPAQATWSTQIIPVSCCSFITCPAVQ